MASQLTLRIASVLDAKGFQDFKREIGDFAQRLKDAEATTVSLQNTLSQLSRVLVGVFATSGIRGFIAASIEQERVLNTLSNRFSLLGESGTEAARAFARLTEAQSLQTRFSQTEQLAALQSIARTAKSSAQAIQTLTLSQDIAAATGRDLSSVAFALGRAQQGIVRPLALVTGLTTAQIREFQRSGELFGKLQERFKGFAERDAQTLGGQLDIIRNKFQNIRQSLGDDLLPIVREFVKAINAVPPELLKSATAVATVFGLIVGLGGAIGIINASLGQFGKAVGGAAKSQAELGKTIFGINPKLKQLPGELSAIGTTGAAGFAAAGRGAVTFGNIFRGLGRLFLNPVTIGLGIGGAINAALNGIAEDFKKAAEASEVFANTLKGVPQALKLVQGDTSVTFATLEEGLQAVSNALDQVRIRLAKLPEGAQKDTFKTIEEGLARQQRVFEQALLARDKLGELSLEEEVQRNRKLTKTTEEIRQLELLKELGFAQDRLRAETLTGEERIALEKRIANVRIELAQLSTQRSVEIQKQGVDALKSQIEAFRRLRLQPLEVEGADPSVLNRRLLNIRQLVQAEQERISKSLQLELQAIDERARRENLSTQEVERLKLEAREKTASESGQVLQEALQEATPIEEALGDARSVRSLVEDFTRQLQAAAEQQSIALDLQVRFGDEQIDRVVRAVERGLRALDIEVEHTARRKREAPSGVQ